MVQPSSDAAFIPQTVSAPGQTHSRRAEDLTYQAFTIFAMLSLLISLWVF